MVSPSLLPQGLLAAHLQLFWDLGGFSTLLLPLGECRGAVLVAVQAGMEGSSSAHAGASSIVRMSWALQEGLQGSVVPTRVSM